jgi:flavin reductase (DIM6/NTAB) family NADH-FMN oxidoreductase RutF
MSTSTSMSDALCPPLDTTARLDPNARLDSTAQVASQLDPTAKLDTKALRAAFAQFATGVTVMTSQTHAPCGMTANAFTSLSMDPPLALVCVAQSAAMHAAVLRARVFGVSVLAADQEGHACYFADRTRPRGAAEFDGIAWHPGPQTGVPLLAGALARLECRLTDVHRGGDHSIFVGEVVGFTHGAPTAAEALIFHRGGFHRLPTRRPA